MILSQEIVVGRGRSGFLKPSQAERFARGIVSFNAGEFFRAHEIWEELWLADSSADKAFLQGLIQLAAAFHHCSRGNVSGAISLLEVSRVKLACFPDDHWGMNLRELNEELKCWLAALEESALPREKPFPRIKSTRRTEDREP